MRYWKKQLSLSLAMLLMVSLALGSLVMAQGQSSEGASTIVPIIENSCQQYSSNRDNVTANHASIVVNGDGTATATFTTKVDCVKVSFSSYEGAADWTPNPGDTTIPYNKQTHYDGQTMLV